MDYYKEIKNELIKNEVYKKVKDYSKNRNDLMTHYNVGKLLIEAGNQYGENIIKEYSIKLTNELGKGYSQRNLRNMRQYYKISQKWQTLSAKLSWSHLCEILWFEDNKFIYYIQITEEQNLSIRQLREKIKSKEYERLDEKTKEKLINKETIKVDDFIKNPILIKNSYNYEEISEKILKQLILEDLDNFLKELGEGFCYVENEFKIKIGNNYNYIDLLLFNYKFNCFIVLELKVTELKKEYIGQVEVYMNYVDEILRKNTQNKTIGIIICKQDNKYVIKYCSDKRIVAKVYQVV